MTHPSVVVVQPMEITEMSNKSDPVGPHSIRDFLGPSPDFSLDLGGPLFQILRGSHLADDALGLARQRVVFFSLFTWLPLLVLSAIDRHLFGGSAAVPFASDIDLHIRFLIALPLLVIAELVVH
jgi:hypothetical protein